jgi:two-component system, sensor histidine kinase and response regulator
MPNRVGATVALPVVMVIDDQTANVQVVGQLLTQADYEVVPVLDGSEALTLAATTPPDLVLLDMRMPGLDGFQVLMGLQALPQTRDVPVIFLTADHERDSLTRAFSAGAVDYITKPFIAEELLARVRTHLDLKQARDRLARVADERHRVAEIVSHDLRNHFANILFSADMLQDPTLNDDARQRLAQSVRHSADAGVLFLQAFLDQQQERMHEIPRQPTAARELLEEVAELLSHQSHSKRMRVCIDTDGAEGMRLLAERAGALHVLQNLLSNALKYAPSGSEVHLTAAQQGKYGRLTVHDRGPGISSNDRERLFQRYVRLSAQPTGGESSTGLGLALAKQRARTMDGDVWYDDREGGGASFTLELPLA